MAVVSGRHIPTRQGHPGNNNSSSVIETDALHNGAQMVALYIGPQTILCDEVSASLKYVGYASPGSDTAEGRAEKIWKIAELSDTGLRWAYVTENETVYAARPEHVWNDRSGLNYA